MIRLNPKCEIDGTQVAETVQHVSSAMGVKVDGVYVLEERSKKVNAYVCSVETKTKDIILTRATVEEVSHDILEGIIAHECGHLMSKGFNRVQYVFVNLIFYPIILISCLLCLHAYQLISWGMCLALAVILYLFGIKCYACYLQREEYKADEYAAKYMGVERYVECLQFMKKNAKKIGTLKRRRVGKSRYMFKRILRLVSLFFFSFHPSTNSRIKNVRSKIKCCVS